MTSSLPPSSARLSRRTQSIVDPGGPRQCSNPKCRSPQVTLRSCYPAPIPRCPSLTDVPADFFGCIVDCAHCGHRLLIPMECLSLAEQGWLKAGGSTQAGACIAISLQSAAGHLPASPPSTPARTDGAS